jgi:hypothetical protein
LAKPGQTGIGNRPQRVSSAQKNPAKGKTIPTASTAARGDDRRDKPVEQEGDKDIKEGFAGARRERQGR